MSPLRGLTILASACLAFAGGARGADVKLPDIGSSAGAIMSPQEQREYGESALHELRSYGLVLDDALLDDYINSLGYRLVANSDRPDLPFTFFVVRDNEINAFAMPGGYIGANAGLIMNMSREDELAAVLAHEIAHITQQHLLRAYEDMKKVSLPVMLAMLGALIASAHRTDDAGTAAIMTGTSLMQQRQINFTRHDEAEADRVGIQTLARAGYDPLAMADTFATLQRVMRVNGVDVPEFLLDHPVDTARIADAKSRAEHLDCPTIARQQDSGTEPVPAAGSTLNLNLPSPRIAAAGDSGDEASAIDASNAAKVAVDRPNPKDKTLPRVSVTACGLHSASAENYFELMRERARVLASDTPSRVRAYYAENLKNRPGFDTTANRYGYALSLVRVGEPAAAVDVLEKLVDRHPSSSTLKLALADALDQSGGKERSQQIYDGLERDFPGNRAVTLSYANSLLARADEKSARRAQDLLRPLIDRYGDDPDLQKSFGRASQLAGDKVRASEAYAEAAYLNGRAEDALNQLKALAKEPDLTFYQRARVDARIAQLTPEVLALRKRGTPDKPESLAPALACCRRP